MTEYETTYHAQIADTPMKKRMLLKFINLGETCQTNVTQIKGFITDQVHNVYLLSGWFYFL